MAYAIVYDEDPTLSTVPSTALVAAGVYSATVDWDPDAATTMLLPPDTSDNVWPWKTTSEPGARVVPPGRTTPFSVLLGNESGTVAVPSTIEFAGCGFPVTAGATPGTGCKSGTVDGPAVPTMTRFVPDGPRERVWSWNVTTELGNNVEPPTTIPPLFEVPIAVTGTTVVPMVSEGARIGAGF